jgi:hypothetical protein
MYLIRLGVINLTWIRLRVILITLIPHEETEERNNELRKPSSCKCFVVALASEPECTDAECVARNVRSTSHSLLPPVV